MEKYRGKQVFQGTVTGKIYFYENSKVQISQISARGAEEEILRFEKASREAIQQLEQICEKAKQQAGEEAAAVFEVHQMMIEDADYVDMVYRMIRVNQATAEYAAEKAGEHFAEIFEAMDDEYMKERAADVRDISRRLVSVLQGETGGFAMPDEPVIVAAWDLTPSQTVQMDRSKILGFVIRNGSANSHTAILARSMEIPALVGVEVHPDWQGRMAVMDGGSGILWLDPDEAVLKEAGERICREKEERERQGRLKGQETVTLDGHKIRLYANIGSEKEAETALDNDAEGIGLFRSEFLYLEASDYPDEERQLQAYRAAAQKMNGRPVIIRTMDIGADKQASYFHLEREENPAMGYRAIRICLDRQEIFRTQLRAILRASAWGNVAVMFPMITSVEEIREIRQIIEQAKAELKEQDMEFREIETGVMIETPAAVWISRELAEEVDFFSIGTNDLTQYILAADRQNPRLDRFLDPHHPAVLRAIAAVVENGHEGGIWVGICGELAADPDMTETLVRMGVDELSVAPAFVLPLRERIRNMTFSS